jgi:hypothetical protein
LTADVQVQIEQAFHDPEGWWVHAVLLTFESIARDFDYQVEQVRMHFHGNYIWYRASTYRLALELDRESGSLTGELWVLADLAGVSAHPRVLSIPRLLSARAPSKQWKAPDDPTALTDSAVRTLLEQWADGLQTYASDVLAGALPNDAPWGRLW